MPRKFNSFNAPQSQTNPLWSSHILPQDLYPFFMSTFRSPVGISEIKDEIGNQNTCCGITGRGVRCKNKIKAKVIRQGHEKLSNLARAPFHAQNLQRKLHDTAAHFLCVRWHRGGQAEQVSRRWYDGATSNHFDGKVVLEYATASMQGKNGLLQPPVHQRGQEVWYFPVLLKSCHPKQSGLTCRLRCCEQTMCRGLSHLSPIFWQQRET